jgi:hypothetical protein
MFVTLQSQTEDVKKPPPTAEDLAEEQELRQ